MAPESDPSPGDTGPADPDDALRWEGDDQPVSLPPGWHAKGRGAERVETADGKAEEADVSSAQPGDDVVDGGPAPLGNAALIGFGMLGGVYLLYTIGWIVGGFRLQGKAQWMVADAMAQGSFWLAVLAPLLWFAAVLLLTRSAANWLKFVWLGAGVVLLVPWPFVMAGVMGL